MLCVRTHASVFVCVFKCVCVCVPRCAQYIQAGGGLGQVCAYAHNV